MKRFWIIGIAFALLIGFVIVDVAFHAFGGSDQRYSYSVTRHVICAIFGGDRTYQQIGERAWMTDVVGGYWCMNNAELDAFDRSRG